MYYNFRHGRHNSASKRSRSNIDTPPAATVNDSDKLIKDLDEQSEDIEDIALRNALLDSQRRIKNREKGGSRGKISDKEKHEKESNKDIGSMKECELVEVTDVTEVDTNLPETHYIKETSDSDSDSGESVKSVKCMSSVVSVISNPSSSSSGDTTKTKRQKSNRLVSHVGDTSSRQNGVIRVPSPPKEMTRGLEGSNGGEKGSNVVRLTSKPNTLLPPATKKEVPSKITSVTVKTFEEIMAEKQQRRNKGIITLYMPKFTNPLFYSYLDRCNHILLEFQY